MLRRVMRKLLHRRCRGTIVMKRREQSQTALGRRWIRRRVELVLPAQEKVASRVTWMMAHVVTHVRRHVGRRMRMVRWIALRMEVMMLLGRRLAGRRLDTATGASVRRRTATATGTAASAWRQLDSQIRQVMRMRGHAIEKGVHHRELWHGRTSLTVIGAIARLSCPPIPIQEFGLFSYLIDRIPRRDFLVEDWKVSKSAHQVRTPKVSRTLDERSFIRWKFFPKRFSFLRPFFKLKFSLLCRRHSGTVAVRHSSTNYEDAFLDRAHVSRRCSPTIEIPLEKRRSPGRARETNTRREEAHDDDVDDDDDDNVENEEEDDDDVKGQAERAGQGG